MRLNVQTGIEGSSVSIRVVVSVSTSWSRDIPAREKLSASQSREADVSVSVSVSAIYVSCPRPIFGEIVQCERALDVVRLCCSYYCSSY